MLPGQVGLLGNVKLTNPHTLPQEGGGGGGVNIGRCISAEHFVAALAH